MVVTDETGMQVANSTSHGVYESGDVFAVSVEGIAYEDYVIQVKGD